MRRWPLSHRPRVADSLCSSGRKSGSGRGPITLPPSERLQTLAPPGDGRALAVDLWWFLLGCFRFLEPLAPSIQQQHGSQRLSTRPLSSISLLCSPPSRRSLTSMTSLWVRFRELHDGRGRGTAESCMVGEIVVFKCGNPTNSLRQRWRVPCVPHPGVNPQHGHQPQNWKRGVSETSRAGDCPRIFTRRAPTPELATTGRHFYAQ